MLVEWVLPMDDPLVSLPPEEREIGCTSGRELVDLALGGHYCIRDQIDGAIREVYALSGRTRAGTNDTRRAGSRAYATEDEIDMGKPGCLAIA